MESLDHEAPRTCIYINPLEAHEVCLAAAVVVGTAGSPAAPPKACGGRTGNRDGPRRLRRAVPTPAAAPPYPPRSADSSKNGRGGALVEPGVSRPGRREVVRGPGARAESGTIGPGTAGRPEGTAGTALWAREAETGGPRLPDPGPGALAWPAPTGALRRKRKVQALLLRDALGRPLPGTAAQRALFLGSGQAARVGPAPGSC